MRHRDEKGGRDPFTRMLSKGSFAYEVNKFLFGCFIFPLLDLELCFLYSEY